MDVSTPGPSTEQSMCPLPPQSETPAGSGLKAQNISLQHQVSIKNRTLVFPSTLSGDSSGNPRSPGPALIVISCLKSVTPIFFFFYKHSKPFNERSHLGLFVQMLAVHSCHAYTNYLIEWLPMGLCSLKEITALLNLFERRPD